MKSLMIAFLLVSLHPVATHAQNKQVNRQMNNRGLLRRDNLIREFGADKTIRYRVKPRGMLKYNHRILFSYMKNYGLDPGSAADRKAVTRALYGKTNGLAFQHRNRKIKRKRITPTDLMNIAFSEGRFKSERKDAGKKTIYLHHPTNFALRKNR